MNSFKEKVEFWDALIGFCGWARLLNKAFQEQPPDLLIERFWKLFFLRPALMIAKRLDM